MIGFSARTQDHGHTVALPLRQSAYVPAAMVGPDLPRSTPSLTTVCHLGEYTLAAAIHGLPAVLLWAVGPIMLRGIGYQHSKKR